ncbi:HET-domain-containing protein [Cadophora sp. DSE1049]|nr:HET-domain-containing protein [Cadophora sp. DSE1049]
MAGDAPSGHGDIRTSFLEGLHSTWEVAKQSIAITNNINSGSEVIDSSKECIPEDPECDRLALIPGINCSEDGCLDSTEVPTLYHAFPYRIADDGHESRSEDSFRTISASGYPESTLNTNPDYRAEDSGSISDSRPRSFAHDTGPAETQGHWGAPADIQQASLLDRDLPSEEPVASEGAGPADLSKHLCQFRANLSLDAEIDPSVQNSSSLGTESCPAEVFHYLVSAGLEAEHYNLNKIQAILQNRGGNIERIVGLSGYWLEQCWLNHHECPSPNLTTNSWPKLPDRVIDLAHYHFPPDAKSSKISVVDTETLTGGYVALSYRWPENVDESCVLSRSTLSRFSGGILASDIVTEIQDACTLTKGLGIRYLWVDALCIIQGSGGDWHVQAEKMASIYKNAVLTITEVDHTPLSVAAEQKHLLLNDTELAASTRPFDSSNPESIYLWLSESGNFVSRPDGELDTRGWAYQEQLLSSRIISLTKDGFFWDCLHHSAASNRPTGIPGDFSPHFRHTDTRDFKRFLLNPEERVPSEQYYWLWRRVVQEYAKRRLTKPNDRYIALQGVTDRMTVLLDDECILGLWRKDALRSLMWFVDTSDKNPYSAIGVSAPSWSWFSVNSPVQYRLWHPYERYTEHRSERVSEKAKIQYLSATRMDPLRFDCFSGKLTIVGSLTEGYLCDSTVYLARRQKYVSALKELAMDEEGRGREYLRQLKSIYTGDNSDRLYLEDALLDFRPDRPQPEYQGRTVITPTSWAKEEDQDQEELGRCISCVHSGSPMTCPSCGDVQKIYCLLLLEGAYTDAIAAQYCLILQPIYWIRSGEGYDISVKLSYRRIGLGVFNTRSICVEAKGMCGGRHEGYSDCMGELKMVEIE